MIHSERIYLSTQDVECQQSAPVKTFDEIAEELGCTKRYVWQLYKNAMKKIRAHPEAANRMRELVNLKSARVF